MQEYKLPSAEAVTSHVKACNVIRKPVGQFWQDGLLLGNGDLAAVAYADEHLEWIINKTDLFDPNVDDIDYLPHTDFLKEIAEMSPKNTLFLEREKEKASDDRLKHTISAVRLRARLWELGGWSSPAYPDFSQDLSLFNGELKEIADAPYLQAELTSFVSQKDSVFCLRIRKLSNDSHLVTMELNRPDDERLDDPTWSVHDGILAFTQPLPQGNGFYAVAMAVKDNPEKLQTWRHTGRIVLPHESDVFLAVKTSRACSNPLAAAREAVQKAVSETFDALQNQNRQWWNDFWKASYADFSSFPELTRQWMFSLYTLGATFGTAPMPGLNGLSYGPGDSMNAGLDFQAYTHDQNVQIAVMPLAMCNHPELVSVLADTYLAAMPVLKRQTCQRFGVDGVFLPLAMNQNGYEYPTYSYRYTICGSAYSGLVLALTWKYSRNTSLLKDKIYPLLKEFITFYMGIMHKGDDNAYHLDWSVPPEIFTLTRDDTATMSMLKTCLETAVEATEILNDDADFRLKIQDVLVHFPQLAKRPEGGWWGGPDIPMDHYCYGGHQMYPFFPSEAYLDEDAIRSTLETLLDVSVEFSQMTPVPHPMHEWSAFLTTAVRSRLQMRQEAWQGIMDFLTGFRKPNGLFAHNPVWVIDTASSLNAYANGKRNHLRMPNGATGEFNGWSEDVTPNTEAIRRIPPVLEGTSAFLFMVTETLLQSWGDIVRLFPAVPENFSGSFLLRAQGGFLVYAAMKDGIVTETSIQSAENRTLHLVCCDSTHREFTIPMTAGNIWHLPSSEHLFSSRTND